MLLRNWLCYCVIDVTGARRDRVIDGHWGAAVLADNGASIATVTREVGGVGRIKCLG